MTLRCEGHNLSLTIFFVCPSLSLGFRVRFCIVSAKHYNHHISKFKISRQRVNLAYQKKKNNKLFQKTTLKSGGQNLSLAIFRFVPCCPSFSWLSSVLFLKSLHK